MTPNEVITFKGRGVVPLLIYYTSELQYYGYQNGIVWTTVFRVPPKKGVKVDSTFVVRFLVTDLTG